MTSNTRSYTVRVNSKILAELLDCFERNYDYQPQSLGSFIRQMLELVHLEEDDAGNIREMSLEEAEGELQRFGVGRINQTTLSVGLHNERLNKDSERKRKSREKKKQYHEKFNQPQPATPTLPPNLVAKYQKLNNYRREIIDGVIQTGGFSSEQIENAIDAHLSNQQEDEANE